MTEISETPFGRRSRALFIAPITPAEGGNGLAMRAGLLLEALASGYDVSLLVVPVAGPRPAAWSSFILEHTVDRACLRLNPPPDARLVPALSRFATTENIDLARRQYNGRPPFDLIVVMRLYLAPFIAAINEPRRTILDLDDDEVTTWRRLSALHARVGDGRMSEAAEAESEKFRIFEWIWLPRFGRVVVCSEHDRAEVAARTGHAGVAVVPNGMRLPDERPAHSEGAAEDVHLTFVASLGYFPNVDAAIVLCRDVLPKLRARVGRHVIVDLVGSRPAASVIALRAIDGVRVHEDVPDVAPFYEQADIAVVPIRAAGGTRMKILEAFAHHVAVVSTSIGAEGLDVVAGRHLLVADEPDDIASACATLLLDVDLKRRMEAEAFTLVHEKYTAAAVQRRILDLVGGLT